LGRKKGQKTCEVIEMGYTNGESREHKVLHRKFKNKYRITPTRLKDWDYTAAGWYFITICIGGRFPFFGEVQDGDVLRSALGEIALRFWLEIPDHFLQTALDEFIIMPNHVHGIIVIEAPVIREGNTEMHAVETQHAASLHGEQNQQFKHKTQKTLPKPRSISAIVRSYKSAVTRWAGLNGYHEFRWQARFYDRIIRSEKSLAIVRRYIVENPLKWEMDDYYSPIVT
jgi:putative transposase